MSKVACLYCGDECFPDTSCPHDGEEYEYECENCGKSMQLVSEVIVEFSFFCREHEHDFETKRHNSVIWDECKRCGATANAREIEAAQ